MIIRAYPIAAQPVSFVTESGDEVTLRPMMRTDKDALLDFFRRVRQEDRFYLKEDVTSPIVIKGWAENLDYARTLPILALVDDKVVGDGTLHHRRSGFRRHIGEVRIVVDPAYRRMGIGRRLMETLIAVAHEEGLEKLMFEVVDGTEDVAKHTARTVGFVPVAILPDHVRDLWDEPHDLVIMELRLADSPVEDPLAY